MIQTLLQDTPVDRADVHEGVVELLETLRLLLTSLKDSYFFGQKFQVINDHICQRPPLHPASIDFMNFLSDSK